MIELRKGGWRRTFISFLQINRLIKVALGHQFETIAALNSGFSPISIYDTMCRCFRKGARAVEWDCLENSYTCKGIEGSNPSSSVLNHVIKNQ
jgi:hypothetical protein